MEEKTDLAEVKGWLRKARKEQTARLNGLNSVIHLKLIQKGKINIFSKRQSKGLVVRPAGQQLSVRFYNFLNCSRRSGKKAGVNHPKEKRGKKGWDGDEKFDKSREKKMSRNQSILAEPDRKAEEPNFFLRAQEKKTCWMPPKAF